MNTTPATRSAAPKLPTSPHGAHPDELLAHFQVDRQSGLTAESVAQARAFHGPNQLKDAEERSILSILLAQFKSLLTLLLGGAALLSLAFSEHAEALAIAGVIALNAGIGFFFEYRAVRSMEALRRLGTATTTVLRDGKFKRIPAAELVPGDIVQLEAGDIVTADLRLFNTSGLEADESTLTGESVPVSKATEAVPVAATLPERSSMVYKGTAITRGTGLGIVVATGSTTELGEVALLADTADSAQSPLEKRLQKLTEQLLWVVLGLMVILSALGILNGRDPVNIIKTAIALAVAAVPEGLPIVATLALARGMWILAGRNALIERLSAVETLGSVSVIFTDKTGTLTENKMTVSGLHTVDDTNAILRTRACTACALCITGGTNGAAISDPMERALIEAAAAEGVARDQLLTSLPNLREESFDPELRMMATLHRDGDDILTLVKGAPEAVIGKSKFLATPEGDKPLTDADRQAWLTRANDLALQGQRLLALADKREKADGAPYEGLCLLGLVTLIDPPRADAAAAMAAARAAGIRVVMATGDNAGTATHIARAVELKSGAPLQSAAGHELSAPEEMTAEQRDRALATDVFARVSPKQKLDLIALYQKEGAVVAMTGDGVNDAPALKKADIGIAMGLRGTEVAKQAADMVLRDDAFSSIIAAIQQGRIIFANIRKFIIYLMSCNLSEIFIVTLGMLSNLPLPLLPLQILFLNLVTDVFPALALGFGRGDKDILSHPPRPAGEGLLCRRHWGSILMYGLLLTASVLAAFVWALQSGYSKEDCVTIAFLSLALGQLFHVFNMRNRNTTLWNNQITRNPVVWVAIGLCCLLLATALLWPPLAALLKLTMPDKASWIAITAASVAPVALGTLLKALPLPSRRV